MIKRHFKLFLLLLALIIGMIGTGLYFTGFTVDTIKQLIGKAPTETELAESIPKLDASAYNRFVFSININTGSMDGEKKDFTGTGAVELYNNISHIYNMNGSLQASDYKAESWTDFGNTKAYKNQGKGWIREDVKKKDAIQNLIGVINNRDKEYTVIRNSSVCSLSWKFDTDVDYLFHSLMSKHTENLELTGFGRITAVFDPKTYEFQYFTIIVSANNSEQDGALLDSVFRWEVKNDTGKALSIPADIMTEAYKKDTGVTMNGGYDEIVNPMAEELIKAYGGTAETTKNTTSSSLFWTGVEGNSSAAVNYLKTDKAAPAYEENYSTLSSVYGEPIEKTEDSSCFYQQRTGELTYIVKGDGWYAEIIVTGTSDMSQGELRKSLITYKSKIGI